MALNRDKSINANFLSQMVAQTRHSSNFLSNYVW